MQLHPDRFALSIYHKINTSIVINIFDCYKYIRQL